MSRLKAIWVASGLLVLAGALAMSGCGVAGLGASPTPTPSAQTIIANVQKIQYKDLEFKFALTGSSSGTNVSGDGTGVITTSPKRAKMSFSITTAGQQVAFDMIADIDGSTVYLKFSGTAIPGLPTDKWIKANANGAFASLTSAFNPNDLTNFNLANAKLKGSETVDGVAVWHLTGTETSNGNTANVDLYVRQDNNQPYKIVSHAAAGAATSGDVTVTFTGINTGATVDLPSADQVVELPTP